MTDDKEKYTGDYKVELSDKGRVSFNLNIKWVVGIMISLLGFIGYMLVDEYYVEPMAKRAAIIEALRTADKDKDEKIDVLIGNQEILLERSERTQRFIDGWIESNQLTTPSGVVPVTPNQTLGPVRVAPPSNVMPISNDSIPG